MSKLEEHKDAFGTPDAALMCLGTTRKDAGSAEKFRCGWVKVGGETFRYDGVKVGGETFTCVGVKSLGVVGVKSWG